MKRVFQLLCYNVWWWGVRAFLSLTSFILFIFIMIECLAIKVVCTACCIEPRMPISFSLSIKWIKYVGKFMVDGDADKPDEDFGGRSYNEWAEDLEKNLKNSFTRW